MEIVEILSFPSGAEREQINDRSELLLAQLYKCALKLSRDASFELSDLESKKLSGFGYKMFSATKSLPPRVAALEAYMDNDTSEVHTERG